MGEVGEGQTTSVTIAAEAGSGSMSAQDVTGLVTLFVTMLAAAKAEIIVALNDNSKSATERWGAHEAEHARYIERLVIVETTLDEHFQKEHDEDIAAEARIRPLKTITQRTMLHWRDIALFVLFILTLLGVTSQQLRLF